MFSSFIDVAKQLGSETHVLATDSADNLQILLELKDIFDHQIIKNNYSLILL